MKKMRLGSSSLEVPVVAVGCMGMSGMSEKEAASFIEKALGMGMNFFDHADIYGGGKCEEIFAESIGMNSTMREQMLLQSKCGIRKGMFDFSKEYIIQSVDGILKRLRTEYLDVLLLHRPDILVEPEEVADAFDTLQAAGKVRHFGVSNQKPMQIELLQKYCRQTLLVNQLQLSITNATMMSNGVNVNMENESAIDRDGSILDYCRLKEMTIQAWSPFRYGFFEGVFLDNDKFPELNAKINEIAAKYQVENTTIAVAWLLRHPAKIQPICGTTNEKRLEAIGKAGDIILGREEWYEIYLAAGNVLP